MPVERYTEAEVIAAVQEANGIKTIAAQLLKCSRRTIDYYCQRYPSVQEALIEAREDLLDLTEQKLFKHALKEEDLSAVFFILRTLGRRRGYTEKPDDVGGPNSGVIRVTLPDELRKMVEANRPGSENQQGSENRPGSEESGHGA